METQVLKDWLKAKSLSRHWLADKCGVSKGTVDQWFKVTHPRPIPEPTQRLISGLMEEERINPKFSLDEISKMSERASEEGKEIDDWIIEAVREKLRVNPINS